jgi:hypothetical protein
VLRTSRACPGHDHRSAGLKRGDHACSVVELHVRWPAVGEGGVKRARRSVGGRHKNKYVYAARSSNTYKGRQAREGTDR